MSTHPLRVHFKGVATLHSQFAFEIYNWHNAPATEAEFTPPPPCPRPAQEDVNVNVNVDKDEDEDEDVEEDELRPLVPCKLF
ncbi:hypothetical protein AWZ03_002423 [Drosophila navojoa]|uniref:Uncharacterized protein n=1 Tax=Drosophila navojoa TaxID=7232 RepID=A0A484BSJ2_DRONA|nr:hypothetical protein AWZ03_002423 [Drosophila navojoa]